MSWLDAILSRSEASGPPPSISSVVVSKPRPAPKPEIKSVFVQTKARGPNDMGAGVAVFYSVADGVLTMHDDQGKQVGVHPIAEDEDPRHMAYRIGRERIFKSDDGPNGFWRPLDLPPLSLA